MNCDDARLLIDAYLDDELDLVTSMTVARHLHDCPPCERVLQSRQQLQTIIKTTPLYADPLGGLDSLQARITAALALPEADTPPAQSSKPLFNPYLSRETARRSSRDRVWGRFSPGISGFAAGLGAAVAILISVVVIGGLARSIPFAAPIAASTAESRVNQIAQEVLTSHIRSLMANHLLDVVSTDLHTVKPWFNGKVDFSPTVNDFTADGFPLVGGRLDYLNQRSVAALVYQRQKHYINLYEWPSDSNQAQATQQFSNNNQGYTEFYWSDATTEYWAISDLNETELASFVKLMQGHANDRSRWTN